MFPFSSTVSLSFSFSLSLGLGFFVLFFPPCASSLHLSFIGEQRERGCVGTAGQRGEHDSGWSRATWGAEQRRSASVVDQRGERGFVSAREERGASTD